MPFKLDPEGSSPCCHMGPICAFFVCIICIISLLYHYYTYYFQIGNGVWVCIHCRKLAKLPISTSTTGDQWLSVNIQTKSIRDSIINLQQAHSHAVSFLNRPIWIGLVVVCQSCLMQFRLELSTQSINSCCNDWALFLSDVIGDFEFNMNLQYNWYN
jgi:hypothetical protein